MSALEYEKLRENKEHTEISFPYNTYLCSIPLDFSSVPSHWHDEMELIVIQKGHGLVRVDLEIRRVKAGDIVVVLPGQLHSIRQYGSSSMEYENIIFKFDMLLSHKEDVCNTKFLRPYVEGQVRYDDWIDGSRDYHREMAECIRKIDRLCNQRPKGYQMGVKSYLYEFFFLLFSHEEPRKCEGVNRKSLDKMKQILEKIEKDYANPLDIEGMAEFAGFSQSHFMKFFKNHLGVSFVQYLNDYRLLVAARSLLVSNEDVTAIAMSSGFPNVSYFNRLFKKKFHKTPLEYRKEHREWH